MSFDKIDWMPAFEQALAYEPFLDRYAKPAQRVRWDAQHARISLSSEQNALLSSFVRELRVLCLCGAWCGDCMNQCPAFDHFAKASKTVDLRFLDRDALPEVREALAINGGHRVPVVVFLSEDGQEVFRYGDRPLSIYRKLGQEQLGSACPTGFVPPPPEAIQTTTQEWLNEFERAHWIVRLSTRLRDKHGD